MSFGRTRAAVATPAVGVLALLSACGLHADNHKLTPTLAAVIPQGAIIVSTSGVGPKDLGAFTVESTRVNVDIQGTCLGRGETAILVDTGDGVLSGGPVCTSRTDSSVTGLIAGNTISGALVPNRRVHIRVVADPDTQWAIAVSTTDA